MPAPLSKEWVEQQLALCEKATPGPWWRRAWIDTDPAIWGPDGDIIARCRGNLAEGGTASQNAHFVATAREGYPMALKELQRLRRRRCTNCEFYAYYDQPLCGFRQEIEDTLLDFRDPDTWYCADWKLREEATDR